VKSDKEESVFTLSSITFYTLGDENLTAGMKAVLSLIRSKNPSRDVNLRGYLFSIRKFKLLPE
jgi:hypothetical protein